MRNLKRALSLTLASVMLLGMMVVGAGAKGYPDVDDNDNVEAIEVLQAVQVMRGDENGNFDPDRNVTRVEMAVVMALLLDLDYQYYEATCPFTDVPEWARGYVGACYANGVTSGYSATTYGSNDGITPVQAASMMMRALGYFKYAEDYNDGFETVTVRQGTQIGIFSGVGSSATAAMTRNQVAQMALNALQSEMVTFTGTPGMEVNGVTVGYRAEYTPRTSTESKYNAIESRTSDVNATNQYYVQLGEELYNGKLRLNSTTDAFERPARQWEYDGKTIGTYVKEELLRQEWTEEVTGKMLYDLLTKPTIDSYDFTIAVDGETKADNLTLAAASGASAENYFFDQGYLHSNYRDGVGGTGNGVLTQVFVDTSIGHVYISIINTYLAKAAGDYSDVRETVTYNVYGVDNNVAAGGTSSNPILVKRTAAKTDTTSPWAQTLTVSVEDFDIEDVKKDDIVLVNVAKGTIQAMQDPEVMASATLSAFAKNKYVVSDGVTINYNSAAEYDVNVLDVFTGSSGTTNLRDKHYNLYLDKYGYLSGIELVEDDGNYIFLTGIDASDSDLRVTTAEAAGILMDGTFINFQMDMSKSTTADPLNPAFSGGSMWNTWCTYSVTSGGVYTLREVGDDPTATGSGRVAQHHDAAYVTSGGATGRDINIKNYSLPGAGTSGYSRVYGNEDSVYMTVKLTNIAAKENMTLPKGLNSTSKDTETGSLSIASNDRVAIISGVDVRSEGIGNTDMTTWTHDETQLKAQTASGTNPATKSDGVNSAYLMPTGVYTLYNNSGYVVAAIVIGEDNGLTSSIYWISSSDVEEERFEASSDTRAASTDGEWVWSREVVDLTNPDVGVTKIYERGSDLSVIGNDANNEGVFAQYGVYQVKFNGNGEVSSATPADSITAVSFTNDPTQIEGLIGGTKELVVYSNRNANGVGPEATFPITFSSGTLHVGTGDTEGFPVDDNALTLLIQTNGGRKTTVPYTGKGGLTSAIGLMHVEDNGTGGTQKRYDITALIRGGRAITIIIRDAIIDGAVANPTNPTVTGTHPTDHFVDMVTHNVTGALDYYDHSASQTVEGAVGNITKWLTDEGYTVNGNPRLIGSNYTWDVTKGDIDRNFTWNGSDGCLTNAPTVTLDGRTVTFNGSYANLLVALEKTGSGSASDAYYLRKETSGGAVTYAQQSTGGAALANGDVVRTGYKQVLYGGAAITDLGDLVDVTISGLELYSGNAYALATATVNKGGSNATGTGFSAGATGVGTAYLAYGSTLNAVDSVDDTNDDGTASIDEVGKVELTVYDDTVGAGSPVVKVAIDVGDGTDDISSETAVSGKGSHMYVGSTVTGTPVALSAEVDASKDLVVRVGYVAITAPSVTSTIDGLTFTWTTNPTPLTYVARGSTVTVNLAISGTADSGGSAQTITVAGATITTPATDTAITAGAGDTTTGITSVARGSTTTIVVTPASGGGEVSASYSFTITVATTGSTAVAFS